ncbi:hypothetical protein [Haloferula sp. BvORR071]|uniref:hypothetical protein n=1 Tax=Haloferula sp. BvORR071 TaxID=1396141 RepID=UPI002240F1BF|nr:hypothetical protein [Haloferula sp. BvORR071]
MKYLVALIASAGLTVAADKPAPKPTTKPSPAEKKTAPSDKKPAPVDKKPAPAPKPAPVAPGEKKKEEADVHAIPPVEAMFSPRLKTLPEPTPVPIAKGFFMAVTASDPKAQQHVLDGISNLHGGWDFEAYRHFCAALQADPECLMAHWGVVVSLIDPEPDLVPMRTAALQRMVELVNRGEATVEAENKGETKEVTKEIGTELERSYAYAIAVFFDKGPAACSDAFRKISEKFPNDPQLKVLQAAFGRGGYDDQGGATPDQVRSETILNDMLAKDPDHPLLLRAYLAIRAEAPDVRGDLERARRLCQVAPGYAPFLHMLGHYELRNGNITQAVEAFSQAGEAYRTWMKSTGVSHSDCPGWVKSECYRAAALATKGDYANALAVAKAVAAIPVPPAEARREGAQLLLWEGRTLAARILMRRGLPGDTALAIAALPKPDDQKVYDKRTHSIWFYQGLAFALEARKKIEEGKLEEARQISSAMTLHGERMAENRDAAAVAGERSAWIRAFKALEITASELLGQLSMAGPKDSIGSAFNWYRAALDRQTPASMLMPPTVLLPMQCRLADYYLATGEAEKAVDILLQAHTPEERLQLQGPGRYTHDLEILTRLQKALTKAGHKDQAAEIAAEIEKVKSE